MEKKFSLLFCDDERLLRTSLAAVMQHWNWIGKIDMASNAEEALLHLNSRKYDMLLLDVSMPGLSGVDVARCVLQEHKVVKVVMLTNYDGEVLMGTLYQLGVHGILLKDTESSELELALRTVAQGGRYFSEPVMKIMEAHAEPFKHMPSLTFPHRHKQVLALLVEGKSVKDIARQLSMSINTINSYKSDMMELTHTQSTVELIGFAQKNGIV